MATKFVSQDYDLTISNSATGSGPYFRAYIQFRPLQNETITTVPEILLSNLVSNTLGGLGTPLGTITDTDQANFSALYAQTRLSKVVVKYRPAQTMGVSNTLSVSGAATFAAQDAVMTTIPIYDNVDQVIDASGQQLTIPDAAGYSKEKAKPYAKVHSIYKPWTRVLKPKLYQNVTLFGSTTINSKTQRWMDLSAAGTNEMNGLEIFMPPIRLGGEQTGTTSLFPSTGSNFVLGKITFQYYQKFKTRT